MFDTELNTNPAIQQNSEHNVNSATLIFKKGHAN